MILLPAYSLLKQEQLQLAAQLASVIIQPQMENVKGKAMFFSPKFGVSMGMMFFSLNLGHFFYLETSKVRHTAIPQPCERSPPCELESPLDAAA